MKNLQKTTAMLLLGGVTFMTLSSFTNPSNSDLIGSGNSVQITNVPSTGQVPNARFTPTLLLVGIYALVTATSTRDQGYAEKSIESVKTNKQLLLNKLG